MAGSVFTHGLHVGIHTYRKIYSNFILSLTVAAGQLNPTVLFNTADGFDHVLSLEPKKPLNLGRQVTFTSYFHLVVSCSKKK